jgi:hypothetical protein
MAGLAFSFSVLPAQSILWLRRYDSGRDDFGRCIAAGRDGNLVVAGNVSDTGAPYHLCILLTSYSPTGDTTPVRYYGGPSTFAQGVAVDHAGAVLLAGGDGMDSTACYLAKVDPSGDTLWTRRYSLQDIDDFTDVTVDSADNVVVAGFTYTYSSGGKWTGLIRKYDSSGQLLWGRLLPWTRDLWGARASGPYFYFAGADTLNAMLVVKCLGNGDTVWTARGSFGGAYCGSYAIGLDSAGCVYSVGYVGYGPASELALMKCDSNGTILWSRALNFTGNDWATDIACDSGGYFYVCGACGAGISDYFLGKFDSLGDTVWTTRYDDGPEDRAYGVAVQDGNPVVTGLASGGATWDMVTIKYSGANGIASGESHRPLAPAEWRCANPVPMGGRVLLDVRTAGLYSLALTDASGRKVLQLLHAQLAPGRHELRIGDIPPGVYFATARCESSARTAKLVVVN